MASFQRVLFKSIDVLLNYAQNKHKFHGITVKKDIVYDEEFPDICAFDTYRHENKVGFKLPTIINFHGGGYMAGDKEYRSGIASFLVDKLDICVINVNYHKCDTHKFPQFARDSMKALDWISTHAEELNIDPDNLYIMGDSAGAQIAAHAITIAQNEALATALGCVRPNIRFKAALLFCGPYDVITAVTSSSILDIARGLGNKVLGINTRNKAELDAYPYKPYLNLLDWLGDDFPPSFIGHTRYDIFCAGQGERLIAELKKRDIPYVSYYSTKRMDYHCWYLALKNRSAKKLLAALVRYMQSMLRGVIPPVEEIVYGKAPKPDDKPPFELCEAACDKAENSDSEKEE